VQRLYGLSNAIILAVRTNSVDVTTADLYKRTKATLQQVDVAQFDKEQKLAFYSHVATLFTEIARTKSMAENSTYGDAPRVALAALLKSSRIQESTETYQAMSQLLGLDGDQVNAATATILGQVITLPDSTVRSKLKINQGQLRKDFEKSALARIGTENVVQ
jgi:hypothetical protein